MFHVLEANNFFFKKAEKLLILELCTTNQLNMH